MKDLLLAVVGLVSVVIAVWQLLVFIRPLPPGAAISNLPIYIGLLFAVVALVCGGMFLSGRVNKDSDIHITE